MKSGKLALNENKNLTNNQQSSHLNKSSNGNQFLSKTGLSASKGNISMCGAGVMNWQMIEGDES